LYLAYQLLWGDESEGRAASTAFVIAAVFFGGMAILAHLQILASSPHRVLRDAVVDQDEKIADLSAAHELGRPTAEEVALNEAMIRWRELYGRGRSLLNETHRVSGPGTHMADGFIRDVDEWRQEARASLEGTDPFFARRFGDITEPLPVEAGLLGALIGSQAEALEEARGILNERVQAARRVRSGELA
jgi:hypothetical protein